MPSFPKPRRPNTNELQTFMAGQDILDTHYEYRNGVLESQYTWKYTVQYMTGWGRRAYGSGYPRTALAPGSSFLKPAGYKIVGASLDRPSGVTTFEYDGASASYYPKGKIARKLEGPQQYTDAEIIWCPYFGGHDFVNMPNNTRIRLGTEVMLKVGGKKASFGEALAESHKTISHLAKTAGDLALAFRAAKRGKWKEVAKHLGTSPRKFVGSKQTSKRWLEFQYAWQPLMSDIYDAHNLVKKGFREKAQLASNVRHISDHGSRSEAGWHEETWSADYCAKVFYQINPSSLSKLNEMGMINPLSVAWEIVPFSFVVDWLVPVGNVLEALTARLGVDFVGGYYGTYCKAKGKQYHSENSQAYQYLASDTRFSTVDQMGYTRDPMTGFPVPGFYWKSPFSSTHALSALALISQLTGKRH